MSQRVDTGSIAIPTDRTERPSAILLRYALYIAALLGLIVASWVIVRQRGIGAINEGLIEHLGTGLLCLTFLVFCARFLMAPQVHEAAVILAAVVLMAIIREHNNFLEHLLPVVGWEGPVLLVLAWSVYYAWRKRKTIWQSMGQVISGQSWPILCCAFLVAVPFAQLIGNRELVSAVMGSGEYSGDVKQAIEELGELFGAGLLLVGAVEMVLQNRRGRGSALSHGGQVHKVRHNCGGSHADQ